LFVGRSFTIDFNLEKSGHSQLSTPNGSISHQNTRAKDDHAHVQQQQQLQQQQQQHANNNSQQQTSTRAHELVHNISISEFPSPQNSEAYDDDNEFYDVDADYDEATEKDLYNDNANNGEENDMLSSSLPMVKYVFLLNA